MNLSNDLDRQRVDAGRRSPDRIQSHLLCIVSTLTVSRYGWYRKQQLARLVWFDHCEILSTAQREPHHWSSLEWRKGHRDEGHGQGTGAQLDGISQGTGGRLVKIEEQTTSSECTAMCD